MPILNMVTSQTGLVGVLPSLSYIETNDPVATVTTPGYLNKAIDNGAFPALPCLAVVSTQENTSVPVVAATYSLTHIDGDWSLTSLNTGAIIEPGIAGNLPVYNAVMRELVDSLIPAANVLLRNVVNTMGLAPSALFFLESNGTEVMGQVSVNGQCGVITSSNLTLASGGTYVMTVTNPYSESAANPAISLTLLNGSNTVGDAIFLKILPLSVGAFQVQILNTNSGALNGTVKFSYWIAR